MDYLYWLDQEALGLRRWLSQPVKCLSYKHQKVSSNFREHEKKPGALVFIFNPNVRKVRTEGSLGPTS